MPSSVSTMPSSVSTMPLSVSTMPLPHSNEDHNSNSDQQTNNDQLTNNNNDGARASFGGNGERAIQSSSLPAAQHDGLPSAGTTRQRESDTENPRPSQRPSQRQRISYLGGLGGLSIEPGAGQAAQASQAAARELYEQQLEANAAKAANFLEQFSSNGYGKSFQRFWGANAGYP